MHPVREAWPDLVRQNLAATRAWTFEVGATPVRELRRIARREALVAAEAFSSRIGVPAQALPADLDGAPIVMTGHQPDLIHPGIWLKHFLVDSLANELGGVGVDLVVDSDGFDRVELRAPAMTPRLMVKSILLAASAPGGAYATTPVPSGAAIDGFRQGGRAALETLPSPALARHFAEFCDALDAARHDARDLGELVTFARRRYEARSGAAYLELKLTDVARTRAFLTFAADLCLDAARFTQVHNEVLRADRAKHRTRSPAQPFPDLRTAGGALELPLWNLSDGVRRSVWAFRDDARGEITLANADGPGDEPTPPSLRPWLRFRAEPRAAIAALSDAAPSLAPKAVALTLFHRMFVCDLFVHGVGGARYERVTDAIVRSYYNVTPPSFAVASISMFLPLGAKVVTQRDVEAAERRLARLAHNPDALLEDDTLDIDLEPGEVEAARSLAAEKASLVARIAAPDADKRTLGARIREINEALASMLEPQAEAWRAELEHLEAQRAASDLVTDRTYPFCLWHPREIQDKAK
jgi:hypothetical protein